MKGGTAEALSNSVAAKETAGAGTARVAAGAPHKAVTSKPTKQTKHHDRCT